jgi:glucose-1-phosphate thymidylyltransferase
LRPFNYPKELLPVRFEAANGGTEIVPTLVIEHSLAAMQRAGVDFCVVVTSESKPEILRYLGDGSRYGLQLAYLVQAQQMGLAHAIHQAHFLVSSFGCNCCLALPDTVFQPLEAIQIVRQDLESHEADLVLGVFPTERPNDLGPVRIDADGKMEAVYDKPSKTDLNNTWAIAAWTPRFSNLVHEQITRAHAQEVILGEVFDLAIRTGMPCRAVLFPEGTFHDLGTPFGLASILRTGWGESGTRPSQVQVDHAVAKPPPDHAGATEDG